ncbi:hypothetical protein [Mesorhizobium sp. SARCC-RB16n]|uniref:hypothetical protein n=1 Tax=Mesorhizobium sp. SARCC-RB16n TaxID=2116687 RepID=UPI00166A8D5C|nr:hypothetical protein [Mesorhizobium sp. SARCC-RB16n]
MQLLAGCQQRFHDLGQIGDAIDKFPHPFAKLITPTMPILGPKSRSIFLEQFPRS